MTVWYPVYTTQMANNLVKWWKTKFLNGYKQFSVECNEGHVSDTEELLERTTTPEYDFTDRLKTTSCSTPPPLQTRSASERLPPPHSSVKSESQASETPKRLLNVEEFSCDVSLEERTDRTGQERQEFSFTLYDFDGRGKITKDDIAGLVTTIYEALGSSIEVPHFGSKTIKVKLTVSPNQKSEQTESKTEKLDDPLTKKDFNVTIRHVANEKRKRCRYHQKQKENKTHYCCRKLQEANDAVDSSDDYSDVCSNVSGNISSEDEENECFSSSRTCKTSLGHKQYYKHSTSEGKVNVNQGVKEFSDSNQQNVYSRAKKLNKRSMSLQRQELLEILQANMDKNNLSFQTKRKQCADHVVLEPQKPVQNEVKLHKHRHKAVHVPGMPFHCLANVINPTHFYVDLASLQNTTQLPNSSCQYGQLIDAVMCVSNKQVAAKKGQGCQRHIRLKSPETLGNNSFPYHQAEPAFIPEGVPKTVRRSKKNCESETTPAIKKNIRKFPQVVLGHTSSPHHLRHRNRQEDKARAMAQVVRWLEQEFSSNLQTNEKEEKTKNYESSSTQDEKIDSTPVSPSSSVERHEHHYVHEHIHHHYHHYQETPVVV